MARHNVGVEQELFDEVADAVHSMVPPELGQIHMQARRWGIKVWFGPTQPIKEHYECQVVGPRQVPEATVLALELGFHSEHPKEADNDAVLDRLLAQEKRWRKVLGPEPVAGVFLGSRDDWRRIGETWIDPDLSDPELGLELGGRLTDYICAIEPLR